MSENKNETARGLRLVSLDIKRILDKEVYRFFDGKESYIAKRRWAAWNDDDEFRFDLWCSAWVTAMPNTMMWGNYMFSGYCVARREIPWDRRFGVPVKNK